MKPIATTTGNINGSLLIWISAISYCVTRPATLLILKIARLQSTDSYKGLVSYSTLIFNKYLISDLPQSTDNKELVNTLPLFY